MDRIGRVMATMHGFSLIELLVVIGLMAILVLILLPALGWRARKQARVTETTAELQAIASAMRGVWARVIFSAYPGPDQVEPDVATDGFHQQKFSGTQNV